VNDVWVRKDDGKVLLAVYNKGFQLYNAYELFMKCDSISATSEFTFVSEYHDTYSLICKYKRGCDVPLVLKRVNFKGELHLCAYKKSLFVIDCAKGDLHLLTLNLDAVWKRRTFRFPYECHVTSMCVYNNRVFFTGNGKYMYISYPYYVVQNGMSTSLERDEDDFKDNNHIRNGICVYNEIVYVSYSRKNEIRKACRVCGKVKIIKTRLPTNMHVNNNTLYVVSDLELKEFELHRCCV